MVKCSLCGAEGVSKITCPLNPNSKNPNPSKHNVNKSSNKDSLHNLIDNISKSCPNESSNLNMLKTLIPDKSINTCITSPPYWGLRDYGTAEWEGGNPACDHVANPNATKKMGNEEYNKILFPR